MELLNCAECGKEIPNSAVICPDCGTSSVVSEPLQSKKASATVFNGTMKIVGVLVFTFVGIFIWTIISTRLFPQTLLNAEWYMWVNGLVMLLILFGVCNLMGTGKKKIEKKTVN